MLLRASSPRASATVAPIPAIRKAATTRAFRSTYTPDTLNNYEIGWKTTSLNGHLIWNGAVYLTWTGSNCRPSSTTPTVCAPSSYYVNVGDARIYGVESNIDYKINDNWSLAGVPPVTTMRASISSQYATFQARSRRTAAVLAVLQLELECALRAPRLARN